MRPVSMSSPLGRKSLSNGNVLKCVSTFKVAVQCNKILEARGIDYSVTLLDKSKKLILDNY